MTKWKETEIGKIPEDWEIKNIHDVAQINEKTIGKGYSHQEIEYIDIDSVEHGSINKIQKLRLKDAPSRAKRVVVNNDTLISTVRPNLKHFAFVISAKPNTIASTGFAVISAKNINPRFLYYFLTTQKFTDYLSAIADAHTSTYPAFNPDVIKKSKIAYPPLKEQKAIAKILSDLDSKIELNNQMNATLEAMAQAIFKHWFIDFEFPDENGKPYKSSGGKMVDSELREIPKGWEVKKLGDLIYLEKGLSYKGKFLSASGNPLINLGCISPKDGFVKEAIKYYNGEFSKRHTVMAMDIVIANTDITQKREILGSPIIIPDNIEMKSSFIFTHHLYAVRFLDSIDLVNKELVYYLMKSRSYGDYVKSYATGTTVLAIPKEAVHNFKFACPSKSLIESFSNLSKTIIYRIQNNQNANDALSVVRDSLLPKLMSGQIRVVVEVIK